MRNIVLPLTSFNKILGAQAGIVSLADVIWKIHDTYAKIITPADKVCQSKTNCEKSGTPADKF